MAQCRHDEIERLKNDITILTDVYDELSANIERNESVSSMIGLAVSSEACAYETSTHDTVLEAMDKSDDLMGITLLTVLSDISTEKNSLIAERDALQTEDDEYHAEEEFKKKCAEIEERERQRLGYN